MAIVEQFSPPTRVERFLTAADLAFLPLELPSGPVDFELFDGRLAIMMSPAGDDHAAILAIITHHLMAQGQLRGHGKARTEGGVVLSRDPDTVLGPDAAFIANRSLPVRRAPEGYLETIPNLVVEIRSKNDSLRELEEKAARYLAAGVELVWLVDPPRRTVIAARPNTLRVELGTTEVLTAEDIIPGFHLSVAELFVE